MKLLAKTAIGTLAALGLASTAIASTTPNTQQIQQEIVKLNSQLSTLASQQENGHPLSLHIDTENPLDLISGTAFAASYLKGANHYQKGLTLGGYLEFDAQAWNGTYTQGPDLAGKNAYHKGSGLFLTTLKLYSLFKINNWASFLGDIEADTAAGSNDTVKWDKALLIIGNMAKSPFYGAIGQSDVPFGLFTGVNGGPWSGSLINQTFEVEGTTLAELGFEQNGFNITASTFNAGNGHNINDFAFNTSYTNKFNLGNIKNVSYSVGLGYLNDMRNTTIFAGNGGVVSTSNDNRKNGAFDANGSINVKKFTLIGEYARGQHTVPGYTGIFSAWGTTARLASKLFNKNVNYSLSYSQTHNMANVPLPLSGNANADIDATAGLRNDWIAAISVEAIHNIFISPEFQYANTYNSKHTWTTTLDFSAFF